MDPEIGKVAVELTGKVAESAVPTLLEKVFGWRSSSKKVNENVTAINTRPSKPRGEWARRHGKKDRRVTNISQRLRKGFWFEYHRKTEAGKFDEIHVSQKVREGLFAALVTEACKYKYFDRSAGSPVEPPVVVDLALEVILADWNKVPDPDRKAKYSFHVFFCFYKTYHFEACFKCMFLIINLHL